MAFGSFLGTVKCRSSRGFRGFALTTPIRALPWIHWEQGVTALPVLSWIWQWPVFTAFGAISTSPLNFFNLCALLIMIRTCPAYCSATPLILQKTLEHEEKTIFSQLPIDILSGRTSYEGVWGCLLNLPPRNCRLFLNCVFQRLRLKTTGQVSPVQFSCSKKLLMKLEVNQCNHAFQEDFVIWFPNQFLAW